jgi:hypothetical protein
VGGTFTALGSTARNRLAAVDVSTGAVDSAFDPSANNAVYALATSSDGGRVYAGGLLSSVNGTSRDRLAAIDASTGEVDPSWNPKANSTVTSLALSPDGRRVYAGGGFTRVGSTTRNRLASIDATTGAVDGQWNAGTNDIVRSLAVSGNSVYVGGDFTAVTAPNTPTTGESRTRLARVDGATGALDSSWKPTADNSVLSFYPSSDGSSVYVGGAFRTINGQPRPYLWALNTTTGDAVPSWQPPSEVTGQVWDIEVSGARVYAAEGRFLIANPGLDGLGVYDAVKGNRITIFRSDGDVQSLAVLDGRLYLGGHFTLLGGVTYRYFASYNLATNRLDPQWVPLGDGHAGPWALMGDPSHRRLYAGGDFTHISGRAQQGFAQFSE